tara:strand:- start:2702 stop:3328 length:627 start_codon:yes stop_codon:yes gene_type:complete
MRQFLMIIIFSLSYINVTQADDIKDFQISKMNVRDSLLNHFDKNSIIKELNSKYTFFYKNKTYAIVTAGNSNEYPLRVNTDMYDDVSITIKPNDKQFIIYGLAGRIFCKDDINYCKSKKKEIDNDLDNFFGKNVEIHKADKDHAFDKTGRSKSFNTYYLFKSGDHITVATYDWHPEAKNQNGISFPDNTKVIITTKELEKFLSDVQYN